MIWDGWINVGLKLRRPTNTSLLVTKGLPTKNACYRFSLPWMKSNIVSWRVSNVIYFSLETLARGVAIRWEVETIRANFVYLFIGHQFAQWKHLCVVFSKHSAKASSLGHVKSKKHSHTNESKFLRRCINDADLSNTMDPFQAYYDFVNNTHCPHNSTLSICSFYLILCTVVEIPILEQRGMLMAFPIPGLYLRETLFSFYSVVGADSAHTVCSCCPPGTLPVSELRGDSREIKSEQTNVRVPSR